MPVIYCKGTYNVIILCFLYYADVADTEHNYDNDSLPFVQHSCHISPNFPYLYIFFNVCIYDSFYSLEKNCNSNKTEKQL